MWFVIVYWSGRKKHALMPKKQGTSLERAGHGKFDKGTEATWNAPATDFFFPNEPVFGALHPESSKIGIHQMHGSSLKRAGQRKLYSSNEPVFGALRPDSSKNRLIHHMHGSSLERTCHWKTLSCSCCLARSESSCSCSAFKAALLATQGSLSFSDS